MISKGVRNRQDESEIRFPGLLLSNLDEAGLIGLSNALAFDSASKQRVIAVSLTTDRASLTSTHRGNTEDVEIEQAQNELIARCTCKYRGNAFCEHEAQSLRTLINRDEYRLFFDEFTRAKLFRTTARDYGLEESQDLESYFRAEFNNGQVTVLPRMPSLQKVDFRSLEDLANLFSRPPAPQSQKNNPLTTERPVVVFSRHKHYRHLIAGLYDAGRTQEGKLKNPLNVLSPTQQILETEELDEIRFHTALSKFAPAVDGPDLPESIKLLQTLAQNPLGLEIYHQDSEAADQITPATLVKTSLKVLRETPVLEVSRQAPFFAISGHLDLAGEKVPLESLKILFSVFIHYQGTLLIPKTAAMLELIKIFVARQGGIVIHESGFDAFKTRVLEKIEFDIRVHFSHIHKANPNQLKQLGFGGEKEKRIYLSDFGNYVEIIPVLVYGKIEVPIRSKKEIVARDASGKDFIVKRDFAAEDAFMGKILQQHPDFAAQLESDLHDFYLHKKQVLDENWFIDAFAIWQEQGIEVFGFRELTGNRLNQHAANISVQVLSGQNWFNARVRVRFGKQKASVKYIHKAIRNKSRFVELGDGSLGILPQQWIDRFNAWFKSGDVDEGGINYPKSNFQLISELYTDYLTDAQTKTEIESLLAFKQNLDSDPGPIIPESLLTALRPYQQEGLKWLDYLDTRNMGGCLADDMGLGKTLQILALMLLQKSRNAHATSLLVLPGTLIFNWINEIEKFAPTLQVLLHYGPQRKKETAGWNQYNLVITSYSTLLGDIGFLRQHAFDTIYLDESQNIKNPSSQRYKAVCLLKARNRFAITGTPIENNTMDLYAQLSFVNPGMLGSRRHFHDVYLKPIDRFKDNLRARELHERISPFILRRTKQEVAPELPEKTEMVLYCDMETAQQKLYNAYEKEFRDFVSATTEEALPSSSVYVLRGLTKLRQVCNSPSLLSEGNPDHIPSAKLDLLVEQLLAQAPGHKILVFSSFVTMLELVRKELEKQKIGCSWLSGSTRSRRTVVEDFQSNPEKRVFLISLKAGGTGLNLTQSDYVYLIDPWWNPAVENQAIDRTHRIGQTRHVIAVRMICRNSIEEKILELQQGKRDIAGALISSNTTGPASLNRLQLLGLLDTEQAGAISQAPLPTQQPV